MKLNLLLIALMFTVLSVFTASCGSSDKECSPECGSWQECNTDTGNCDLKTGFCDTNDDCDGEMICGSNHKCKAPLPAECINQCTDQDKVVQGTCSLVGGLPACECNEGFLKSQNGLRCLKPSDDCKDESLACGGNGECIANNNGKLGCKCDDYYTLDATDPMLCVPTVICSPSNHEGSCEFSCEKCMEDKDNAGNWKCAVPDGDRPCYKNFNDQCDPGLGFSNNPGCAGDMFCLGDTAEDGYCSTRTCTTDAGCPTTYGDQFTCKYYGDGFIGICIKGADSCFNDDGTRKGGGEEGDACSDECQEADCNVGNLCEKGFCSKKCSGPTDLSCGTDRGCVDLSGDGGLFYCAGPIVGVGEDCLDAVCANGLMCLGDQQTWANCFMACTTPGSEDECAAVGVGSKCENFGQVGNFCGAPQTQSPGEECDQFSHGCIDDGWCLGTGGDDPSYCFAACTEAKDVSDECGGEKCVHFGTAPNDGYYCEIAPSRNPGDECNMVNGCVDDGWCLGTGGDNPSYCFASCTEAKDVSDECGGETCVHFGTAPNDGFYCEIAPSRNPGEECDAVNGCVDDGWCLSIGDGSSYCFAKCEAESDSDGTDCAGEACIKWGAPPASGGFYCEIAPSAEFGDECDAMNTCLNDGLCLTTPDTEDALCYEPCTDATSVCTQDGFTCVDSGDATIGWFCADNNATDCTADTDCENNTNGLTVCDTTTTNMCVAPAVEVTDCSSDANACDDNTNGLTECDGTNCVAPHVDATDCSSDANACDNNTNGLTACDGTNCVAPVEVTDCSSDANACDDNTNGLTACDGTNCVAPHVDATDCSSDANACDDNTNGLTSCDGTTCVAP